MKMNSICKHYGQISHLFESTHPFRRIMASNDQRWFVHFLIEIQRHRDTLLRRGGARGERRQLQITQFFQRSTTPHPIRKPQRIGLNKEEVERQSVWRRLDIELFVSLIKRFIEFGTGITSGWQQGLHICAPNQRLLYKSSTCLTPPCTTFYTPITHMDGTRQSLCISYLYSHERIQYCILTPLGAPSIVSFSLPYFPIIPFHFQCTFTLLGYMSIFDTCTPICLIGQVRPSDKVQLSKWAEREGINTCIRPGQFQKRFPYR